MGLDELIQNLESLIGQMEYVKDGEYVFSRHTNLFVDFLKDAIEVCKELYQKFKDKTGKTLPKAEEWLSMAETRYGFTRKVAFGDTVLPSDHNLIIDTLKPLEMVLR
ncbi:MAG: hypothetical protein B9J98_08190, partial [Candidatus Terraquivivens tikiterensis]